LIRPSLIETATEIDTRNAKAYNGAFLFSLVKSRRRYNIETVWNKLATIIISTYFRIADFSLFNRYLIEYIIMDMARKFFI